VSLSISSFLRVLVILGGTPKLPLFISSNLSSGNLSQYPPDSYLYLYGDELFDEEKWHYKDPKGQERGPFGAIQMDKWVKYDFFKVDLLVRREYQSEFIHLGDIFFTEQRNPFTGEPLMEWFQGPSSEFKTSLMLLIQNFLLNRISSLDLSTSTGYPQFYSAPVSVPTKEPTTTPPAPTPIYKPPEPTEIPKPNNWWESSDAIPKRSLNPHIEKPSPTTAIATSENDREHLQEKQTKALQQVLEDMKLANEEQEKKLQQQNKKKKKGKKKEPQAITSTTSTTTSSSTTAKENKSKSVKENNTQNKPPKANKNITKSEVKNSNNNNTKTQSQNSRQTSQKPKPQYKLKESPPSEPNPSDPIQSQSSPLQPSKRQHIKPAKVWKVVEKSDVIINPDQVNIEQLHPERGVEEKTTQGLIT